MNIFGIKVTSHDTGAALISGNQVVAIAEERLNRVKHSHNMYPALAIDYCLNALGVAAKDIDLVVLDQVGYGKDSPSNRLFFAKEGDRFSKAKVAVINHHDAHAAAAFFASPFTEAAVLIVDGAGERLQTNLGIYGTETETLYKGVGNSIVQIEKALHIRQRSLFPYTVGVGKLYTLISEGYLNFGHYNEGKMMGLAPYGDDRVLKDLPFSRWFSIQGDQIICNPRVRFAGEQDFLGRKKVDRGLKKYLSVILRKVGIKLLDWSTFARAEFFAEPIIFEPIILKRPARKKEDSLSDPYFAAVAYAVQKVLEEVMVILGRKIRMITGVDNLCVGGGVGLNIDANKRFLDDAGFKHIFVQPAASDTGVALGCALWGAHIIAGLPRFFEMKSASLGRLYSEAEFSVALEKYKDRIVITKPADIAEETARLIVSGKIAGWFSGGSEYGPRALGNRSILCDARRPDMKDIVNKRVKHRESWRPFAASILAEEQRNWFGLDEQSPFMLLAAQVVSDKKALVPSVVHVDGTCRIQSVTADANLPYWKLLSAFKKETGVPLVLNTSFNLAGEPIVETPDDALSCFLRTDLDFLALGDYLVTKKTSGEKML